MKKLTLALVALLICTSVFAATTTVTAGLGFGGYMIPRNFEKNPVKGINDHYIYNMGPAFFVGMDYVNEQGLTIYDDVAFNLSTKDNGKALLSADPKIVFITATEYAGVGYTFKKDLFTVMAGAGIELKNALIGLDKIFDKDASFVSIGLGARIKGSYTINEMFDVSAQINPSFNFKNITNIEKGDVKTLLVDNKLPLASGNLLIGATYKF